MALVKVVVPLDLAQRAMRLAVDKLVALGFVVWLLEVVV